MRVTSASLLLVGVLSSGGVAQERGLVCVLVDDATFASSDLEGTERLLSIVRDEILTEADLVGFVSTGRSGVAVDLAAADRARLDDAIARVLKADGYGVAPGRTAGGVASAPSQVSLDTASDVIGNMARLQSPNKYLVWITSDAASLSLAERFKNVSAAARAGNISLRTMSAADPTSPALLRSLR